MHDLLTVTQVVHAHLAVHSVISAADPTPAPVYPTDSHTVAVALIGAVAAVVTALLGFLLTRTKRERTPDSTVDSIENRAMRSILEDLDECNYAKDNALRELAWLREAVRKHRLDPDVLIREVAPSGYHG